ncbi:hypothetical protein PUNSTDRAFT_113777 [Punctularia strigosozonata HHB-11173 SS5]|uniref:uncharacterized protein n=1 Tax=Punctularia strigosozonata (strain HHB-11173) TaxID=741275 RepID=UPI00044184FC|nr:uncharacterized protein PUNSTDRAFT_113777 [Punctularia strigosozonata HHB-11173 SS5]EIN08182.1 hypothetical protein PUNSTDRAFT_113777 [Punctularia strigosozonata HHB-11173 SS5]
MNPYASWGAGQSNPWGSVPPPSILGALPSLQTPPMPPGQRAATPNVLAFHFTSFNPTIMNCTVVGPQSRTFFRVVSDPNSSPFCSIIREFEGRNVALVEWQQHPKVEIAGIADKQRVQTWLGLSSDRTSRNMYINNVGYKWTPSGNDICAHNIVTLELTYEAMQSGLLEPCVVATLLLCCGRNID